MFGSVYEAIMLICFGIAWPVNIAKSYKTRSAKGKSLFFLLILEIGYVSGIVNKLIYSRDIVMVFYIINFVMVFIDILLYFRNKGLDRAAEAASKNQ